MIKQIVFDIGFERGYTVSPRRFEHIDAVVSRRFQAYRAHIPKSGGSPPAESTGIYSLHI